MKRKSPEGQRGLFDDEEPTRNMGSHAGGNSRTSVVTAPVWSSRDVASVVHPRNSAGVSSHDCGVYRPITRLEVMEQIRRDLETLRDPAYTLDREFFEERVASFRAWAKELE